MAINAKTKDKNITQDSEATESARIYDINNYFEVKDNPISKVGVFPYLGASIGAPIADKVYMVYRSAIELSDAGCVDSFKLLPWVDDHTLLGSSDIGLTPPEDKGVQGTTGEQVYFSNDTLYANLKLFSQSLADSIENGKKELSCGYRCVYKFQPGEYNGTRYDAIQTEIRGNHLALVDSGRMGKEVAVMDSKNFIFTIDSKELKKMADKEPTIGEVMGHINTLTDGLKGLKEGMDKMATDMKASMDKKASDEDVDMSAEDKKAAEDKAAEDAKCAADKKAAEDAKAKEAMDKKIGMDASEVKKLIDSEMTTFKKTFVADSIKKEELANKASNFVGTFDHREMSLAEVAQYCVKKLEITCDSGAELAALEGFFVAKKAVATFAKDEKDAKVVTKDFRNKFIKTA